MVEPGTRTRTREKIGAHEVVIDRRRQLAKAC